MGFNSGFKGLNKLQIMDNVNDNTVTETHKHWPQQRNLFCHLNKFIRHRI